MKSKLEKKFLLEMGTNQFAPVHKGSSTGGAAASVPHLSQSSHSPSPVCLLLAAPQLIVHSWLEHRLLHLTLLSVEGGAEEPDL